MKQLSIWALAAMLLFVYACSEHRTGLSDEHDGQVEFRISTSLLSDMQSKGNSAYGGIGNVDRTQFDLRYVCEAWTQESTPRLAYREVKTTNDFSQKIEFSARLLQQKYDFVFWADFVDKNDPSDKFYKTNNALGLRDIEMIPPYSISNDAKDAYFASLELDLSQQGTSVGGVLLKRPFGKIRIVASDEPTTTLPDRPKVVAVKYVRTSLPSGFNALEGVPTDRTIELSGACLSKAELVNPFKIGDADYGPCYVLAYDYLFASATATSTAFNLKLYSDDSGQKQIGVRDISAIPVEANKLTTVIGNFYTVEGKVSVVITDPFDNEAVIPLQSLDVKSIDAVNHALENAPSTIGELKLNVTSPVSGTNNEVVIPDAVMASNTPTVSLNFADLSSGTEITIRDQNPNTISNNYDGQLYVTIPDGMSLSNLKLKTSSAHVVVTGSYGQVVAHTSPATFIVPKGSAVSLLQVEGGNVEVHGTVASLEVLPTNNEAGRICRLPNGTIGTVVALRNYTLVEDFTPVTTTAEWLAALAARTPKIYMVEGVYDLTAPLTINYPVELLGEGGSHTVVKSVATTEPAMLISVSPGNNVVMDGIGFVGQKKHTNAGCLLVGTTANPNPLSVSVVVNNCSFSGFTKNSVTIKGGTATVSNNEILCGYLTNAAANGIQIDNGCVAQVSGNKINGYVSGHPSWSATGLLVLRGGQARRVAGNVFTNCQTAMFKETFYDAVADNTQLDAMAETNNSFTGSSWEVFRTNPPHLCPTSTLVVTTRTAGGGYSLADGTFQYAPAAQCKTTIAAAVTAASAVATTDIRLDAGTWTQTTPLGVAKNINLIGVGADKTIIRAASGNVVQVTAANTCVSFKDLHVQGVHTNIGIRVSADNMTVRLDQVKVSQCKYGLYFSDNGTVDALTLNGCLFDSNDLIGAYIGKAVSVANVNNTVFSNNGNVDDAAANTVQKVGLQFCDWDGREQVISVTNSKFINNGNSPSSVENRALTIYTTLASQQPNPILTMSGCVVSGNARSGGAVAAVSSGVKVFNATNVGNQVKISSTAFSNNATDLSFYRIADQVTDCGDTLTIERR